MICKLYANGPRAGSLTITNGGTPTGYTILNTVDWGNVVWQHASSGPRGTQGARAVAGAPDNRPVAIPIRIGPTGSVDSANLKALYLAEQIDDMRRYGGRILMQTTGQSQRQWLDVMQIGISRETWGRKGSIVDVFEVTIQALCGPYMLGDPMDTFDGFDTNTIADYTADAGAGTLSVSGGLLDPSDTTLKRFRHTAKGYSYGDVQVTLKVNTSSSVTGGIWGVMLRADTGSGDTSLVAELVAGTNVIRVGKYVAGSFTSLATAALTPLVSTTYWVRGRVEGNLVFAEVFTSAPTPTSTPAQSVSYALTGAEAARFYSGHAGIRITPASATESYDDLAIEPFTYRNGSHPEQLRLQGAIPGDTNGIADVLISPLGGAAAPVWGMTGWSERPPVWNLCWNGDFENATIGTGGWFTNPSPVLAGTATSLTRNTTAALTKYGGGNLSVVTPATTDTGAGFAITYRFKKGRQYAAWFWASSAAQTTSMRAKLGISGDFATGTAAAISATRQLYAVTWTPTADRTSAYVAFGTNAATATTFSIDGVCVVEVPSIALSAGITSGATTGTVYATPTEIPFLLPDGSLSQPFYVVIDQEMLRVTAISGLTWTWDRGAEGSAAAAHSTDAMVIVAPVSRAQLEGKGAAPAFTVLEGESCVLALSSFSAGALGFASDANARGAVVAEWTPATSGVQTAVLTYFVDPSSLLPDDYTAGEVDVEVWVKEKITPTITSPRAMISAQPEYGTTFGPERFTREYGNLGKTIIPASATAGRIHRLGVIPMVVDRANPQRWRLRLTLSGTGGATPNWDIDYLHLVATRGRLSSPTGEVNDTASGVGAYPSLIPYDAAWGGTSSMTKILRSDMSAMIAAPGGYAYPDAGLGRVIEPPDGDIDATLALSTLVPDDYTVDATSDANGSKTATYHLAATPRYMFSKV